jgi:hypothetical protein
MRDRIMTYLIIAFLSLFILQLLINTLRAICALAAMILIIYILIKAIKQLQRK